MATTKNKNSTKNTARIIHFSNMPPPNMLDLMQQIGRIGCGGTSHDDFLYFNNIEKNALITYVCEAFVTLHRDVAALRCHSQKVLSAASKGPPLVGSP